MKKARKIFPAVFLVLSLLLPASLRSPAAASASGITVGADRISDESRRSYVNAMLEYHLSEKGEKLVSDSLRNGKIALFFFEGASNHALSESGFSDYGHYRFAAVCIVVRLVQNAPEIVFFDDFSSTLPDNPRAADSRGDAVATLLDGVYPLVNCNHFGYAALHVPAYDWGTAVRCFRTGHYTDVCYGINIHGRGTDYISPVTNNSSGCLLVGRVATEYGSYNDFMLAATGIENAHSSSFDKVAEDCGCVIIDRALYKNELRSIYDAGVGDQGVIVGQLTGYTDSVNASAKQYIPSSDPSHESSDSPEETSEAVSEDDSEETSGEPPETSAELSSEAVSEAASEITSEVASGTPFFGSLWFWIAVVAFLLLLALLVVLIAVIVRARKNRKRIETE